MTETVSLTNNVETEYSIISEYIELGYIEPIFNDRNTMHFGNSNMGANKQNI